MKNIDIFSKRLQTLQKHYNALKDYKLLIDELIKEKDIYDEWTFNYLKPQERAILDAYLKRFASMQDYLGAKIFPLLLEIVGYPNLKMSEVLGYIEKEGIIDSFDEWMELREARNELEHDYPLELKKALDDLKFCVENFE